MSTIINFPKTNPIIFQKEGEYDQYMDVEYREKNVEFYQQFAGID